MVDERRLVGETIAGRFRLTRYLGRGAMAAVYAGEQDAEPQHVAVKVMHSHLNTDASFAKRFKREAKAASALAHPNSVSVFDYGVDREHVYIAMELLRGRDLFEVLRRRRKLTQIEGCRVIAEVCDALTAAHNAGIVHRDLKPENVMLLEDAPPGSGRPWVKVLDFGIAKILTYGPKSGDATHGSDSALTVMGSAVGTPEYMSPEQCRGQDIDHRSDIYSAGLLLFQVVSGSLPFSAELHVNVMLKQVREAPPLLRQFLPEVDAELERLVHRTLSKTPAERPQTAYELGSGLRRIANRLEGRPAVADASGPYRAANADASGQFRAAGADASGQFRAMHPGGHYVRPPTPSHPPPGAQRSSLPSIPPLAPPAPAPAHLSVPPPAHLSTPPRAPSLPEIQSGGWDPSTSSTRRIWSAVIVLVSVFVVLGFVGYVLVFLT